MRAATYIRMSTAEQENSPERQRDQVEAYCRRRGYHIVKRYQDLGLVGYDDTRPDFRKLIADAQLGLFDVLVCDEPSRLSRSNPLDYFALVAHPLERAGVTLDTVAKGVRSWDDLGDIIVQTVDQHAASGEVVTLSRRVVTELARKAPKGDVVSGKPPYGYALVWINERGEVVHRGRKAWDKRPPGWLPRFEPVEAEADVVRFIFDSYVSADLSLNGIAHELRRRGVLSPRGGQHWNRAHLRNVLTNRAYVGDWLYNRTTAGAFHRLAYQGDGERKAGVAEPKRMRRTKTSVVPNPESDWVVLPDHHPPIVDRDIFQRAAAALQNNRERSTPMPSRGDYALSKVLVCSHCGSWMVGDRDKSGRFYQCGGYARYGSDFCNPHRVREVEALAVVEQEMAAHFLSPERLDLLRAEARRRKKEIDAGDELARHRKAAAVLDKKLEKARANLLLLDADLVPAAAAQVKMWDKERLAHLAEADRLSAEKPVEDVERLISFIETQLWAFRQAMASGSQEAIRRAVRATLVKMELRFTTTQKKVRRRHRLSGGVSHFAGGEKFGFDVEDEEGEPVKNDDPFCTGYPFLILPFTLQTSA